MASSITRRLFLERVGQLGGATAVYGAMSALQLAQPTTAQAFAPVFPLTGRAPRDTRVIILGAGLAGMATAYELGKLGYAYELIESRARAGGRCFTIRGGTASEETGPPQTGAFAEGLYLNAGPARIPHHHAITLDYCRELGVAVEMFCSVNEAAYVHTSTATDPAARKYRVRELRADWRGHTAELLAKAISQESLDRAMTREDRDRIVEWLTTEAGLGADLRYTGTPRRGYRVPPGAGLVKGDMDDPLGLDALLRTGFAGSLATELNLQTPMFQPVGGMDSIAKAFAARVPHITLGASVQAIEQPAGGVRVRYRDARGVDRVAEGAFCVSTLPLPVLNEISADLVPEMKAAIGAIRYASTGKIGLQFKRRFWEQDEGIYGGITRTDLPITQILYPSYGFLSQKGILVGYYYNGEVAATMGALTPQERLAKALEQGAQIHPQYPREFETAFSVAWHRVPHSRGGWAQFTEPQRRVEYARLIEPDRGVYLAGDYTSYQVGWMAGAFASARRVVALIHERASREASTTITASTPHQP